MSVSKASLLSSADRFSLSLVELSESFSTYSLLHTLSNPDMHTSPAHCSYTHHGFWRSLAFTEVIVSCRTVPSSTASGFAVNCLSRLMLLLAAIAFNLYSTHLYTHLERNSYRTILDITYSSANMSYSQRKMESYGDDYWISGYAHLACQTRQHDRLAHISVAASTTSAIVVECRW
jgi:hypothetical protein